MKKKYLLLLLVISTALFAGLPPTATKLSGESSFKTTFNTDFGSLTGTRSGTTVTPNQTGTGSLVLSNSPTLATPNIGAATATSLSLGVGSSSAPSLFFDGDTTTGMYRPAANQVAFTVSGTPRVTVQSSGTVYTAPNYAASGTVGAPSYSFTSGVTSGLYRDNATAGIRMSAVGTDSMTWASGGNVGVGTTSPNANAILDVSSTTKAFMPPRMTKTQKEAVSSPTAGMNVYDSDLAKNSTYNGQTWAQSSTDRNLLLNGDFEGSASIIPFGWTCTVGTCTKTTTSGEYILPGKAAMKIALSAQSMDVSQTLSTSAGVQKQGYLGFSYRFPASGVATPSVTITVDSGTPITVPSEKLIMDGFFHSLEVPVVFGSTDIKISFLTGSSTGDVFLDEVYLKQGLGLQNLQLDNVYSAYVSTGGVVSGENVDWISGNCTSANPYTCTFNTGLFTSDPNCQATILGVVNKTARINSISTASIVVSTNTVASSPAGSDQSFFLTCQKSGNDYLAASASVYSQASGIPQYSHYSDGAGNGSTATKIPYFSTLSASSGSSLYICSNSSTNGLSCTFLQPAVVRVSVSCYGPNGDQCGISKNASSVTTNIYTLADSERVAYSYVSASTATTATANIIVNTGDIIRPHTSGQAVTDANSWVFTIAATQANNVIVGSFAGVPAVPGYEGKVDTFSVSYGATATSVCATGTTCAYSNAIGAGVSIGFSSTGNYLMTLPRTYTELKCTGNSVGASSGNTDPIRCSNCSSVIFQTRVTTTGSPQNSYGTIMCQGQY